MRKIGYAIVVIAVALLALSAVLYWRHFRGAWVAVKNPIENVVEYVRENQGAFTVPKGYRMQVFAEGLAKPRDLVYDPSGVVVVSIPSRGEVVALPDADGDGEADRTVRVVGGLNRPHGVVFRCPSSDACELYVAETDQLAVYTYDPTTMQAVGKKKLLDLPDNGANQHFTRSLLLTALDGEDALLISVGSSCNVCNESDARRAKVLYYTLNDGKSGEYARGLRNAVFMTHHPVTGEVWVTEMGRDLLGDDTPPEEINILKRDANYGWPTCYGDNVHDTQFDKNTYIRNPCMEPFETPAHITMQAHSAPLGLAFVPTESWPDELRGDLLVAFHGSWNRTVPTGYKIVRVKLDENGNSEGIEDFITGWLQDDGAKLGRPVDILMHPEDGMYISDDGAGIVYYLQPEK